MSSRSTEWRKANPEKAAAWYRKYYRANCERIWAYAKEQYWKQAEVCAKDAAFYATYRAAQRKHCYMWRKNCRGQKTLYKPAYTRRIPDWAVKGPCIMDMASPFLIDNITDSQRAFARELAIERRAAW